MLNYLNLVFLNFYLFSLVTGIITLLQPLNLDNPNNSNTYFLEIEARDNGNNTSTYVLTVFVENVDDPIVCDSSFSTAAGILQIYFIHNIHKTMNDRVRKFLNKTWNYS